MVSCLTTASAGKVVDLVPRPPWDQLQVCGRPKLEDALLCLVGGHKFSDRWIYNRDLVIELRRGDPTPKLLLVVHCEDI